MARKKLKIDTSVCIGCGACVGTYPDDLKFSDEGLAEPITGEGDEEAVDVCPVGAISVQE